MLSQLLGYRYRGAIRSASQLCTVSTARTCMSTFRPEVQQAERMTDTGTRRVFSEEHDMFRDTVRKWWQKQAAPYHDQWEEAGIVPRSVWEDAGSNQLLGLTMPEEFGGAEADIKYAAIMWEEQSYSYCTGPGFTIHSDIVLPYIAKYGSAEQKAKYLPKLISGEFIGSIAMTEPGAGSDLQNLETSAKLQGDKYVLSGSKTYISNGIHADVVIVVAKTSPEKGAHGFSLFLVEDGMDGFEKGKNLKKMGMKAQDTAELFFDSVELSDENMLGNKDEGFYMLMNELPQERLLIADIAVSSAEAIYETTRDWLRQRKAFGQTLHKLQAIRHRMAEMKTSISVARSFVDNCIELHSQGKLDPQSASMAKYWCSDLQNEIAGHAVQLHGGMGYMSEHPICRAYQDARVQTIYGGSNEIMKELIARTI